ncbi:MAG: monovalent cation/H(+) antiporter subunit G [Actinomycetaceae bacterium]
MSWDIVASVVAAVLLVAGSLLVLVAALALVRFPDLFARMHAAAKPQVLGLALLMAGVALETRDPRIGWTLILVVVFQLLTAPISAHMAGRGGYRTGRVDRSLLVVDELAEDIEASGRARDERHTGA